MNENADRLPGDAAPAADRAEPDAGLSRRQEARLRQLEELVAAKGEYIGLLRHNGDGTNGFNWKAMSLHRQDIIREMDDIIRRKDAYIAAIFDTWSWRLTQPLRRLHALLREPLPPPAAPPTPADAPPLPAALAPVAPAEEPYPEYDRWFSAHAALPPAQREALRARLESVPDPVSFLVAVRLQSTGQAAALLSTRKSLDGQSYPRWRLLLLADPDAGLPYPGDSRVDALPCPDDTACAAAVNAQAAAEPASAILWLEPGDRLAPDALLQFACGLLNDPEAGLVYADEDRLGAEGRHGDPFLKPDWNPDLALSFNYVGRCAAWRASAAIRAGGLRPPSTSLDNWEPLLRATSGVSGARVRHIPAVLLHTATPPDGEETSGAASAEAHRVLSARLAADRRNASLVPVPHAPFWRVRHALPNPCPRVSIVIPTRNGWYLLRRCLDSLFEKTRYPDFEIVVVDNDSDEAESRRLLDAIGRVRNIRVERHAGNFNYAAIVNAGVRRASGPVLAILNNDTEIVAPDWLEELASHACRPEVGAAGALLLHRDGTIQHAGVFLGTGGGAHIAGNALSGLPPSGLDLQRRRFRHAQNFSAVTGACLALRKTVFEEVGGLDEIQLPVAFNDVDLCLRIRQLGYRIVWTPHAVLYHEESSSRGFEDTPEKHARFLAETAVMQGRWGDVLRDDPAYNANLSLENNRMELADQPRTAHPPAVVNA